MSNIAQNNWPSPSIVIAGLVPAIHLASASNTGTSPLVTPRERPGATQSVDCILKREAHRNLEGRGRTPTHATPKTHPRKRHDPHR